MNGQAVGVVEGGMLYLVRSDHIGRPVFATNTLGIKVWEASYLPFGGVHTTTGSPTNLRFPGQWFQSEAGLHQNWMRDYDPTTGRYVQGDPLGLVDGASVYGYALQNPGRYFDPTGEAIPAVALACLRNAACRSAAGAAAGAAANALYGWYTDEDGCYEFGEAVEDALVGAAAGATVVAGAGAGYGAATGYRINRLLKNAERMDRNMLTRGPEPFKNMAIELDQSSQKHPIHPRARTIWLKKYSGKY